jgi:hypothetical protein
MEWVGDVKLRMFLSLSASLLPTLKCQVFIDPVQLQPRGFVVEKDVAGRFDPNVRLQAWVGSMGLVGLVELASAHRHTSTQAHLSKQ